MDKEKILAAVERYRKDMSAFLRAMISHPSESCEEKEVVACIKAELEKLGYDEVEVDGLGNVIGWMGQGDKIIAIDSHIDTVGIGNRDNWTADPYEGWEDDAHVQALVDAHHTLFGGKRLGHSDTDPVRDAMHLREGRPLTDKWTFSTNGVAIQGRYGIPCVGFGPGAESQAHAPNEITWKDDLVRCAALYAAVPSLYKEENKTADVSQFRAGKTDNDIQ